MAITFDPARFNALLMLPNPGLAQAVLWARATACPCRSRTSGAADTSCPICHGKGHFYATPVAGWTGLAGQKILRQWEAFGQFELGDVVVTIPGDSPIYGMGEHDQIVFTNSTEPFSQIVMGGVDTLPYQTVSIDRVAWRDPTTRALVEGGLPTQDPTDNSLTWVSGAPPVGVQYVINGRRHPIYWVFVDFPQDRAHSAGLRLPRRCVLRKYALAGS